MINTKKELELSTMPKRQVFSVRHGCMGQAPSRLCNTGLFLSHYFSFNTTVSISKAGHSD